MHSLLRILAVLSLGAFACAAEQNKTLWQIGQPDRNDAEFALAPKSYEQFIEDGFFIVGQSAPASAWPYVHPGPRDTWAGGRSHTFTILFGVDKPATQGTCRLVIDAVDTHYHAAPPLRIEINGQAFERALPTGSSDASINGNPDAGKACQVAVEFPASLLRTGNNQINITTTGGSWFLYDSLALEVPAAVQTGKVQNTTALLSARAMPALIERDGQTYQNVAVSITHAGEPQQGTVRIGTEHSQSVQLAEGRQTVEVRVPAVTKATVTTCTLAVAGHVVGTQSFTLSPGLKEIVVVFKTHFDIGYTDMASNIVQRYRTSMIEQALDVVDQNRDLPPQQQFAWTLAGWPMTKILQDWPGQTAQRKERVEKALTEGRFVVHGLPFTTHTELLETEDLVRSLGYSARISRRLGLALPRDGKMTDVPEHTWMMATMLKHAGIEFLMIGCNGASAPLKVPWLYWWQGPDGSRILTFYSPDYGTQLAPPPDWPYRTWLACLHTGDNHGPPRPDEVKKVLDQAAKQFPGVKVHIGRLSDFADAILAERPDIPVVRGDTPDTWIHGPMCDPSGAKLARHTRPLIGATEALNTELRAWGVPVPDVAASVSAAYEQSLLYGEHTWGGAIYWIANKLSYGDQFHNERAQGRFNRLEGSWDEHSAYIQKAHELIAPELANNLQALANGVQAEGWRVVVYNPLPWKRTGLVNVEAAGLTSASLKAVDGHGLVSLDRDGNRITFIASDVPALGYRTYAAAAGQQGRAAVPARHSTSGGKDASPTLESPFFSAKLDPSRGIIRSLVDKRSGRELAGSVDGRGLGQYLYERFDNDQVMGWCNKYVRGYMYPDFFKPQLPPASQSPYESASPKDFKLRFEENATSVTAVMDAAATGKLPAVTTRLILYRDQPYADLEITLHDKPFDPWPEAGWLCLPLEVNSPQFRLGRLGSIIDPAKDVITGANRYMFGINTGLSVTDSAGRGVGLCPMDYPLVSLDTPGCWQYSLDFVPRKPVVYVNLFNNQWSTNFRLWNQGTWTSRVRLWAVGHADYEPAIITPSLEARYPLLAAVGQGAAGSLPARRTGVELSRKGVLVTAYGANPNGPGTILRLWELAGRSGSLTVRLPQGSKVDQVQPVDLRACPIAKPIAVKNGAFKIELDAFAPASFVIGAKP